MLRFSRRQVASFLLGAGSALAASAARAQVPLQNFSFLHDGPAFPKGGVAARACRNEDEQGQQERSDEERGGGPAILGRGRAC